MALPSPEELKKKEYHTSLPNPNTIVPSLIKQKETGDRYVSQMRAAPDLLNPFQVQSNVSERFLPSPNDLLLDQRKNTLTKAQEESKSSPLASPLVKLGIQTPNVKVNPALPTWDEALNNPRRGYDDSLLSPSQKYVEDRLERERESASSNPVMRGINTAIEPLSRVVYQLEANMPGLAAFQEGTGQALGVKTLGAPVTGPAAVNIPARIAGNIAGGLTNPSNIGQGLVTAPLQVGRGVAQAAANKAPVLGNKFAQRGIEGAVAGGIQGGVISGVRGETDAKELATNIGLGVGLGAAGDMGLTAISSAVKAIKNSASNAAQDVIGGQLKAANAIERTATSRGFENPQLNVEKPQPIKPELQKEPWFNKLFGSSSMGITPGARDGKTLVDTQIVSRSKEQGPILERVGDALTAANENYVDRFAPFHQINKETYNAAMDSTRANNLANITIKDKFVDLEGNVLGKSLKEVYENVPRGMKNIADRYTIARDAVNRMDRGITVYGREKWFPQTADEASKMVADLEKRYPWLKNFGEDWNQFNRNRQDLWVQSGIASDELINTLRHTNPNYAPMMRQQSKDSLKNRLAFNSKSGFSGQKAPIQRAVGSTKKIVEPARGMIESTGASYNAMLRNRAMVNLYEAVKANPEKYKGVIDIVEDTADMKQASLKAINEALADNGPDGVAAMLNDELNSIFKKAKQATGNSEATVTVMLNGSPLKLRVSDPSLLKAIEGIAPEQLGGIVKVFNVLSRGIKQAATGTLAPLQGLKLAIRDLPIAMAQSKDKKRFITDISHAMISQVGDWLPSFVPGSERLGRLAREYYRAGGGYEAYLKGDSRLRAVSSDLTRDPILSGRNLLKTVRKANPLKPFKAFGDAMENVPRIAAFSAEMRKNGWKRDPESVRSAIDAGREATVNWSRRGAKGSEIEAFLPYSNAAVQGTYRLLKRFREQPISATALVLAVAGSKIAAYEDFKDDPDYQQRSKFEKGIPVSKTADGKFITVPVEPTEAYIADQILHFYKWATDGEKAPSVKENIQEGADAFLPKYVSGPIAAFTSPGEAFSPTAAVSNTVGGSVGDPINALVSGKNFYGGDIVPREYQDSSKAQQYNETTSAAGKWAAENLGIDAFTFDYLGQRFGGDIAKVGLPMTSQVGSGDPVGNVWDETLTRLKLLEDPVMKNRIADDFFSYSRSATEARTDHNKKDIPLPEWYQAAYDEVTSTKKGSITSLVQDLNSQKKDVERNPLLLAKERADKLRDIQREMNLLRIEGIKRLEELGVPKTRN